MHKLTDYITKIKVLIRLKVFLNRFMKCSEFDCPKHFQLGLR